MQTRHALPFCAQWGASPETAAFYPFGHPYEHAYGRAYEEHRPEFGNVGTVAPPVKPAKLRRLYQGTMG
jgi:hypothetical protein